MLSTILRTGKVLTSSQLLSPPKKKTIQTLIIMRKTPLKAKNKIFPSFVRSFSDQLQLTKNTHRGQSPPNVKFSLSIFTDRKLFFSYVKSLFRDIDLQEELPGRVRHKIQNYRDPWFRDQEKDRLRQEANQREEVLGRIKQIQPFFDEPNPKVSPTLKQETLKAFLNHKGVQRTLNFINVTPTRIDYIFKQPNLPPLTLQGEDVQLAYKLSNSKSCPLPESLWEHFNLEKTESITRYTRQQKSDLP